MVLYHANVSPRTLSTVTDPIRSYPAFWELMKWYRCWRKYPYQAEIHAALVAEGRPDEYAHYPCPLGTGHWHIGRGGEQASPRHEAQGAKRAYRKAVRDEIYAEYLEKQRVVQPKERSDRGTEARYP